MEQSQDQRTSDRTESTIFTTATECQATNVVERQNNSTLQNVGVKLCKSCEDLSDHHLKRAHHQCLKVFEEFVRVRKISTQEPRSRSRCSSLADSPPLDDGEPPQKRQAFRRLSSEPIGCTTRNSPRTAESGDDRSPYRCRQRSKDADSIEEEREAKPDCVVRSKPLDVVQVRPCSLVLQNRTTPCKKKPAFTGTHTRMPSNSGSDNAPTPASDPLFSPIGPGGPPDFLESYPPLRPTRDLSPLAPLPGSFVTAGTPGSQRHTRCEASTSLPVSCPARWLTIVYVYSMQRGTCLCAYRAAEFTVIYGDSGASKLPCAP